VRSSSGANSLRKPP